jgi:S-methylmethionine-dependent homocysteine/selenocysteine methylase
MFLTDGGLETTLIFEGGFDLPCFAAFHLLRDPRGREALVSYFERYAAIARAAGAGIILDSPSWRASADWGEKLGYSPAELAAANRECVALVRGVAERWESPRHPAIVSGCVGPRGDGYDPPCS